MVFSKIKSVEKYLPEKILTNHDLEKMVETSDQWIRDRTGIQERRIAKKDETSSSMATEAVKLACKKAGIEYSDVDYVICTTNSPDMIFPATAMKIINQLGLKDRPGFDLQAGCTSFCYGLDIADSLIRNGNRYENIVVVGVEKLSSLIDWEDRNTCVLFGDGSGAAIIQKNENDQSGIITSVMGGDASKTHAIRIEAGMSQNPANEQTVKNRQHYVKMEGQDVFKFAVRVIPNAVKKVLKRANMTLDDVKLIIPHQANTRIIESAAKLLKVDYEKFYVNIQKYGNTSSATIPIAMNEAIEEGKIKEGDIIITVGFGAGLTYAANLIRF